jgi:hypothetical protein
MYKFICPYCGNRKFTLGHIYPKMEAYCENCKCWIQDRLTDEEIEKEKEEMNGVTINDFRKEYFYLSNFYKTPIIYEGLIYGSTESAFQAAKTLDLELREAFCKLDPSTAKKLGRNVPLRNDWEEVKYSVMKEVVLYKFSTNSDLRRRLLDTGNALLIEGNTWNDTYWGVCNGKGENNLGKILMEVRELIK